MSRNELQEFISQFITHPNKVCDECDGCKMEIEEIIDYVAEEIFDDMSSCGEVHSDVRTLILCSRNRWLNGKGK